MTDTNLHGTDVAIISDRADDSVRDDILALRDGDLAMVSTFGDDQKIEALAAISNSTLLTEQVNKELRVANIIVQLVTLTDDETGEVTKAARTVLVTDEGDAYHGTSKGLLTSVRNILGVAKDPSTWPAPLVVIPKQEGQAPRQYTTLKIVGFAKTGK